jgi:hypothetical protein
VIVVGTRRKYQAPPPQVVFDALCELDDVSPRRWLVLLDDERPPTVVDADRPSRVVWSSLWPSRPDALVRFDLEPGHGGTSLRWTLTVGAPAPDEQYGRHLRRRINVLINAHLRESFDQ